ncbi:MAG: 4-hydroxy-3-methylbut-2-enyl diphosphate reductase [Ignavibacteriaceae bacterium]
MRVEIDKGAGFCWGVVRAVDFAENELKTTPKVYSLGDVIHNTAEVKRLNALGLETVSVADFPNLPRGSKILIRAHGEPPETYANALEYGLEIVDATCPVVTKVQERIRKFYIKGFQVLIFGKKDHAEVIGLKGVTEGNAKVIKSLDEALEVTDFSKPTVLFSQTTMDKTEFSVIAEKLRQKIREFVVDTMESQAAEFHAKDTICGQVSGREKKLREFAMSKDVIVFAAGKKSSNGKVLFNICKEENPKTYFVEDKCELESLWFVGAEEIGITGATSTPQWLMEEIKREIESKN